MMVRSVVDSGPASGSDHIVGGERGALPENYLAS